MTTFRNQVTGKEHAIVGVADAGIGTHGTSKTSTGAGGVSTSGVGVHGVSTAGPGVRGDAAGGLGVLGASKTATGVKGLSDSGLGVEGASTSGDAVFGASTRGRGVVGVSTTATGVEGSSDQGAGLWGRSKRGEGLHATTDANDRAAVAAVSTSTANTAKAIYAKKAGELGHAGYFDGHVHVTKGLVLDGDLTVAGDIALANADVAEQFELVGELPGDEGCVVVLAGADRVSVSTEPYDRRVAGVVSGAGSYRPALVLDHRSDQARRPIALTGKVWCHADADHAPIAVGDLLTTSATPGHAMRAADAGRAFGAVIGKSLADLPSGQALIPVLVALQ
jgi:hypothetical protein